ncbi:hypothetical protein BH10PSE2_BH10PSE2_30420 [soil metagenome]
MRRRDVLVRLGLIGATVGGGWWFRDHVLWPRPAIAFGRPDWTPWDHRRADLPTVSAVVAGRPVRALIDSGAQYSVIDRGLAATLPGVKAFDMPIVAYGVGGRAQLGKGVTVDVGIGGTRIGALRAAILDLGPLASSAGLGTPLILGQDVLGEALLDLDVERRRLRFLARGTALPDTVVPLPTRRARAALTVAVVIEGQTVDAVIDTGSSSLLALSRTAATRIGLFDGRERRAGASMVLGGSMASTLVEVRDVTIGDLRFDRVETAVYRDVALPGFPDALIGMAAFAGRRAVFDLGGGSLHVSRPLDLTVGR